MVDIYYLVSGLFRSAINDSPQVVVVDFGNTPFFRQPVIVVIVFGLDTAILTTLQEVTMFFQNTAISEETSCSAADVLCCKAFWRIFAL